MTTTLIEDRFFLQIETSERNRIWLGQYNLPSFFFFSVFNLADG